jgi:ribonuclease BN (tRNA processing enzyme)
MLCTLIDQMDGAHFPVTHEQLPSIQECYSGDPLEYLAKEGFKITRQRTNHPGKCYGYRLEHEGKSIVFMPDNELHPPGKQWASVQEIADFCRGADVLLHDAQFVASDFPMKRGWGHSLVSEACELAAMAEVKHLILFHHDPERTDDELDKIQADYRAWFAEHFPKTQITAGYEGMVIKW